MPKEPANPSSNGQASGENESGDEFNHFKELARKLVRVPKREIDAARDKTKST